MPCAPAFVSRLFTPVEIVSCGCEDLELKVCGASVSLSVGSEQLSQAPGKAGTLSSSEVVGAMGASQPTKKSEEMREKSGTIANPLAAFLEEKIDEISYVSASGRCADSELKAIGVVSLSIGSEQLSQASVMAGTASASEVDGAAVPPVKSKKAKVGNPFACAFVEIASVTDCVRGLCSGSDLKFIGAAVSLSDGSD